MAEQPINLSPHQVQQLQQHGHCTWCRDCDPYADLPFAIGQLLWGREPVARQAGTYRYLADGRQPGLYYGHNYHMPRAACRWALTVAGAWYELDDAGQWTYHLTLKTPTHALPA